MSKRGKLTPTQINVLWEMATEGRLVQRGTSYRTGATNRLVPQAATSIRVLWRHYLCTEHAYDTSRWWVISDRGREALANEGMIPHRETST